MKGSCYIEEAALSFYQYVSGDAHQNVILYGNGIFPMQHSSLVILDQIGTGHTLACSGDTFLLDSYGGKYTPQGDIAIIQSVEDPDTYERESRINIQFRTGSGSWGRVGVLDGNLLYFSPLEKSNTEDDQEILSSVTEGIGDTFSLYSSSEQYGTENILVHYENQKAVGVVVTTLGSGIVYARLDRPDGTYFDRYYQYSNLPMYQSWQSGNDQFRAVGFSEKGDFSWEDIVYARVYEYSITNEKLEQNSFQKRIIQDGVVHDSGPRETEAPPVMPQISEDMKEQIQKHESKEYETHSGTDYQTAEQTQEVLQGELESMWEEKNPGSSGADAGT